jgi:hypothetical protein
MTKWVGVVFDDGGGKRYTKNFGGVVDTKSEADTFTHPDDARDCARAAKLASFTAEGVTRPRHPWIDRIDIEEEGLWVAGLKIQSGGERYLSKRGTLTEDLDEVHRYGTEDEAKKMSDGFASGIIDANGTVIYRPGEITGTFARRVE